MKRANMDDVNRNITKEYNTNYNHNGLIQRDDCINK